MAGSGVICVVNRTNIPLQYIKGGQQYVLEPGENHILASHLKFAVTQNPLMGTENPRNPGDFVSLVGIKGLKANKRHNDCSPIIFMKTEDGQGVVALFENGREHQVTVERIDRSKLSPKRRKAQVEEADFPVSRYFISDGGESELQGNSAGTIFPGANA